VKKVETVEELMKVLQRMNPKSKLFICDEYDGELLSISKVEEKGEQLIIHPNLLE
jgi:hypothetical protein